MAYSPAVVSEVCVIGSGFAGTAVAQHLVERGVQVVLLEAGQAHFDPATPAGDVARLPVVADGDADFDVDGNRAIVAGGASNRWNGVATRPEAGIIDDDWPIGAAELSPFLDRAEAWLHVHGSPAVPGAEPSRSGQFLGELAPSNLLDHPGLDAANGFVRVPMSVRRGGPVRLIEDELSALTQHPLCTVLTEHLATRLVERPDGALVECATPSGVRVVAAQHVVVAAGVVDTVRLLLASSNPDRGVATGDTSGWLGAGINAHPRLRRAIERHHELGDERALVRSYLVGERLRQHGHNSVVLDVNYLGPLPHIDVTVEQRSVAANRLVLEAATPGVDGPASLRMRSSLDDIDRATLAAASHELLAQARRLPGGDDPTPQEVRWFHPAGGCRMSHDPADGVVDVNLAVHGRRRTHVVGASVFPRPGASNPTVTVVALALRLADRLAGLLRTDAARE